MLVQAQAVRWVRRDDGVRLAWRSRLRWRSPWRTTSRLLPKRCNSLETRELCDSHFLPAGFYRILGESEIDKNPVRVNKTVAVQSSAQARAHFLCSECEGHEVMFGALRVNVSLREGVTPQSER